MKLIMLYLTVLIILTACHGQTTTQTVHSEKQEKPLLIGETVKELSNNIMIVYQDKKNNYWFGSWKDGLYKYDGQRITHFTTKDGLLDNRIEDIKDDKLGNIYISTANGLCRFDGKQFASLMETKSLGNGWQLNPDDLWFKNGGAVYRFDGHNLFKLELPPTKISEDYRRKHPNFPNPAIIYCIYKDSKGNMWFGTAMLGVCRYDGQSFDWISEPDVTEFHDGPANGVRSITEDKNGDFWFNTAYRYRIYKNNLLQKNTQNAKFYDRIESIGCLDGKKDGDLNEYLSIIKDNNNNLWMAIYNHGVWKYDGENIQHYPMQVNFKNITVYCLYKDNKGDLWLGTEANSVFRFNGQAFERFGL